MIEIIYLQEKTWQRIWSFLRFQTTFNHVGLLLEKDRYIHLSYDGVKISKLGTRKHIKHLPKQAKLLPTELQRLYAVIILEHYTKGKFKSIKLTKYRLAIPFLPNPNKDSMLCNEFVDYLFKRYLYINVDSLKIARQID